MAIVTYNPQTVNVMIQVSDASAVTQKLIQVQGYAEGTFIEIERSGESWTGSSSADGVVNARSRKASKFGTIKFTLHESSQSNDPLTELYLDDEKYGSDGGKAICTISIVDNAQRERCVVSDAYLKMPAGITKGDEMGARTWTFEAPVVNPEPRGQ